MSVPGAAKRMSVRQLRWDNGNPGPGRGHGHTIGSGGTVKVADRRHTHAWVPTGEVPTSAPAALEGLAQPFSADGQVHGWWFDTAAALAGGHTNAAGQFARWAATFTNRTLLGETSTVEAVFAALGAGAPGHLDSHLARYLEAGFLAVGGADLSAFIATEYDAEIGAGAAAGDAIELHDNRGPITARVWPATEPLTLSSNDTSAVGVDHRGLWLTVGDTKHSVEGWRIDGATGDVVISTDTGTITDTGTVGTLLTRQAAGSVEVWVKRRPFSEVCSEIAELLYNAADAAARGGKYLLVGIEPERRRTAT